MLRKRKINSVSQLVTNWIPKYSSGQVQDNYKKRKLLGKTVEEEKKKNQETFVSYSQLGLQINTVKKAVVNS